MPSLNESEKDLRPIWEVVIPSGLIIAVLCGVIYFYPDIMQGVLSQTFAFISQNLGAGYLWFNLFLALLSVFFLFSRYGNVKFGGKDEKPAFSDAKWISMMFCAGVAGAVMFWSIAEPLYDLNSPPMGAEPHSVEAYKWATSYALFSLGPTNLGMVCYLCTAHLLHVLQAQPACFAYFCCL